MLTVEILKQNLVLAGLTDAQLSAIAEMSRNDENTVIGTRIGEIYGQFDADVFSTSGISKNAGEKSYDYAKRVITDFKTKAESYKTAKAALDAANTKIAELQTSSADEALKKDLKDAKTRAEQLQASLTAKEKELGTVCTSLEKQLMDAHVDYAFKAATSGLKFKDGFGDSVKAVLLNAAKAEVLAKGTPEFIDDNKGGKRLAFRDANGQLLNNPENSLAPYTMEELVMKTSLKDAITTAPVRTGGGTGPVVPPVVGGVLDLSSAKTQVEADNMIDNYLLTTKGYTRDSAEFADEAFKLRSEAKIASLPIR